MSEPTGGWHSPRRSLLIALAVTVVVTGLSHVVPGDYANTAVGIAFLGAAWWAALRSDAQSIRAYGLSLGGLTEPVGLDPRRIARDFGKAMLWATGLALICLPPFWYGYKLWWGVSGPIDLTLPGDYASRVLGQVLVIALPEEAFFRGYLQSSLDGRWAKHRWRILGAEVGPGWLLATFVFAVGHVLTVPHPSRLAVFVPALLFGWLRARTGGIGAPVAFHAMCNLFSAALARGYGLQ